MSADFNNCPSCGVDFNKDDIYNFFLKMYKKEGIPKYAKNKDEIKKVAKQYPSQYDGFFETAKGMGKVQLAALESAYSYGWRKNNPKCFRKEIGIEIIAEKTGEWGYDGISLWKCPDCGHIWKRGEWVPDHVLEEYINCEKQRNAIAKK